MLNTTGDVALTNIAKKQTASMILSSIQIKSIRLSSASGMFLACF